MQVRNAFWLCACLVFGTAGAQTTTLEYQGDLLTGTSTTLLSGATGTLAGLPLTGSPYAGQITGTITVSGQPDSADLTLVAYEFSLIGQDGSDIDLIAGPTPLDNLGAPPNSFCGDGCIDLTVLDDSFVGATLDLTNSSYHTSPEHFVISPSGDSVSYLLATSSGTCQNEPATGNPDGTFTYEGPTIHDCSIQAANSDSGRWSVVTVPELDEPSALGAVTFLLGALAVVCGRKRKPGAG